jgi:hypothetical protein
MKHEFAFEVQFRLNARMIESDRGDVLLVGSLPFDTAQEAISAAADHLGDHLPAMGDGEVGLRKLWIGFLPMTIYSKHPALDTLRAPEGGVPKPHHSDVYEAAFLFGIKHGQELRFETTNYGPIAVESYEVFKRLREEGVIPDGVRFQVTFPGTGSAISYFFREEDWPAAHAAYHDAIRRDIELILEHVPASELQFQFDLAQEFVDMASGDAKGIADWPDATLEEKIQRHAATLPEMTRSVPGEARVGFHWCYGTWGGWPMKDMADLGLCVRMTREAIARVGRRVDYVHMPVLKHPEPEFFAPLAELDGEDVDVYLGIIHHTDGVEGFGERMEMARRYRERFGIGSVCGYGRVDPGELPHILAVHRDCAAALRALTASGPASGS